MGKTTIHVSLCIEGAIRRKEFSDFLHDDGIRMKPKEAEEELWRLFRSGVRYLPIGNCPTFDPVHGCPGHREEDADG